MGQGQYSAADIQPAPDTAELGPSLGLPSGVTGPAGMRSKIQAAANMQYDQSNPGSIPQTNSDPADVARAKTFTPYGQIGLSYPGGQGQVFKSAPGQPMPTVSQERQTGAGVGMVAASPLIGGAELGYGGVSALLARMGLMGAAAGTGGAATSALGGTPITSKGTAEDITSGAAAELGGSTLGAAGKKLVGSVMDLAPNAARSLSRALPETGKFLKQEEAANAMAAIHDQAARTGVKPETFQGRAGLQAGKDLISGAQGRLNDTFEKIISPFKNEPVPADWQAKYPALAEKFGDQKPTLGDVNAARIQLNKDLHGFYRMNEDSQIAAAPQIQKLEDQVNQARDLVYSEGQQRTGIDLRDMKQKESSLIRLNGLMERGANQVGNAQDKYASAASRLLAPNKSDVTGRVISAIQKSPLEEFNSHMAKVVNGARSSPFPVGAPQSPAWLNNPGQGPRPEHVMEALKQHGMVTSPEESMGMDINKTFADFPAGPQPPFPHEQYASNLAEAPAIKSELNRLRNVTGPSAPQMSPEEIKASLLRHQRFGQ